MGLYSLHLGLWVRAKRPLPPPEPAKDVVFICRSYILENVETALLYYCRLIYT